MKKRSNEMDIIRGIGIILVVILHVGIPSAFWTNYFNLFHMAIFFFSAGYCFDGKLLQEKNGTIKYVVKKIKGLYYPYVIFNGTMTVLNNFLLSINIYTDDAGFLEENIGLGNAFGLKTMYSVEELGRQLGGVVLFGKFGETQLGGATWFLRALFVVSLLFFFSQKIMYIVLSKFAIKINEITFQIIIAVILLYVGWEATKNGIANYYSMFSSASIYFVYVTGYFVKEVLLLEKLKKHNIIATLGALFSFCFLMIVGRHANIAVNANSYTNPFWLFCGSVFGSFLCLCIAIILENNSSIVRFIIGYIGKNSLYIMMFHFLAFKIITLINIFYYDKPSYLLAAFPVLDTAGIWRYLYVFVGVTFPLLLRMFYKYIIDNMLKIRVSVSIHK